MDKRIKHCATVGRAMTSTYRVWLHMRARCTNPRVRSYPHYGGRGIVVCDRWRQDFSAFLADMGERPDGKSLDRINNDGPYSPENCRWATDAEQHRNTRKTKMLTFNGRTMCMKDWAAEVGLRQDTLWYRLSGGMSVDQALTTPVMESRAHRRGTKERK